MYEQSKLLEEFTPDTLIGYVRNIPEPEQWIGSQFLPVETINDLRFEYIKGSYEKPIMAAIMAWDAEAPIAGKKGVTSISGEMPPIKRKIKVEEKELIKFFYPRPGLGDRATAIGNIYDLVDQMVMACRARMEWLRWQAIATGAVTYNEEDVIFTVDYGVPASQKETLAGTAKWSDLANSDPLGDLERWTEAHVTNTGIPPERMIMSLKTRGYLLRNEAIRQIITASTKIYISPQQLNDLLANFGLPQIVLYDAKVLTENHDGTKTESRFLEQDVIVLLPAPTYSIGKLLQGPTAEALATLKLDSSTKPEGVVATVYSKEDPPSFWIKAAATAFPTLPGAELIGIYNVW